MQKGHRRQLFPQQRGLVIPVGSRAYRRMKRKQHMVTLLLIVLYWDFPFYSVKEFNKRIALFLLYQLIPQRLPQNTPL